METLSFIWSNDAEYQSHEVRAMLLTLRDFHLVAGSEAAPYLNYCRKKEAAVHRIA